jgi:hypothetical protein
MGANFFSYHGGQSIKPARRNPAVFLDLEMGFFGRQKTIFVRQYLKEDPLSRRCPTGVVRSFGGPYAAPRPLGEFESFFIVTTFFERGVIIETTKRKAELTLFV